ncbi:MAG: glycosyltransferase family 39 protein [Chthoniobacterales bacterium]
MEIQYLSQPDAEQRPQPGSTRARFDAFLRSWMFRDVLIPFITARAVLTLIGWLALQYFHNLPANPGSWELNPAGQITTVSHLSMTSHPLLNMYSRWDAGWYHSIAKQGYSFKPGRQSNTAFFPLYPALMRAVHVFIPSDTDSSWFLAGVIASNCAFLVALCYLLLLLRMDFDQETSARAVLYLLVFPTAFYFFAVYGESVSLATTVAAFYYARKNNWWLAGAFAGAATLTRSPGVLLGAPLLAEYLGQREFRWRSIRADILSLGLIPACLIAHMLFLRWSVGNVTAIQDAQAAWGSQWGRFSAPWAPLFRLRPHPFTYFDFINVGFAGVMLVLVVLAAARLRLSYGVYAVTGFWFITSWGTYESMPRYVIVLFPAFLILAKWGHNRAFDRAYVAVASALAALFMTRFTLWLWVA